jgi:hypothetical protein
MNVGILGGGFGLYGYLPACINLGWKVHTLNRYCDTIVNRPELQSYLRQIDFHDHEESLTSAVDSLICARDPDSQEKLVKLIDKSFDHLFLEKPLTANVFSHIEVLDLLLANEQNFSVGYLFSYTDWFDRVINFESLKSRPDVAIEWNIRPKESDWKFNKSRGGGLGSFYGIHFIPLIISMGLTLADLRVTATEKSLVITSVEKSSIDLSIRINLFGSPKFDLTLGGCPPAKSFKTSLDSPFGDIPINGLPDPRIGIIARYMDYQVQNNPIEENVMIENAVIEYRKLIENRC